MIEKTQDGRALCTRENPMTQEREMSEVRQWEHTEVAGYATAHSIIYQCKNCRHTWRIETLI